MNFEQEASSLSFSTPATAFGNTIPSPDTDRAAMKNSLCKEKFKTTFVRPLYKVKFGKKTKLFTNVGTANLVGDVNVNVAKTYSNVKFKDVQKYKILPGGCENYDKRCDISDTFKAMVKDQMNINTVMDDSNGDNYSVSKNGPVINKYGTKNIVGNNSGAANPVIFPPETWLRVYPARAVAGEGAASIAFRCATCQLGLTAFLVLWTLLAVFVIHSFEAPHETTVTLDFVREQNQLVIDLATELRQITPISPKWREAIEKRIEEGRRQTMVAAGRGAKLDPGQYWSLGGTFLFTVYVMTALGFGAPVPQTVYGRCLSLLYAVFAVPTHVYLMMNASRCAVAHIEYCLFCKKKPKRQPGLIDSHSGTAIDNKDSPSCSTSSDVKSRRRRKFSRMVTVLTWGHCVPLASALYYAAGVLIFGLVRKKEPVDILLFPLQFTTGGGLASVEWYFRMLYGFYVEGAMMVLSCAVSTLRRYSGNSVNDMTVKYRLFARDKCGE